MRQETLSQMIRRRLQEGVAPEAILEYAKVRYPNTKVKIEEILRSQAMMRSNKQ